MNDAADVLLLLMHKQIVHVCNTVAANAYA